MAKYEGVYLYGSKNGRGKEYDRLGNLLYQGKYLYGKRKKKKANCVIL